MKNNFELLKNFHLLQIDQRLHKIPCPIIAITGGIATGKSTVVKLLKNQSQNVIQADLLIKEAYQQSDILDWLLKTKPQVLKNKVIDFVLLRSEFFGDQKFKKEAEKKLYAHLPTLFWQQYKKLPAANYLFYEVPLLFEKKLDPLVDLIVLIHATKNLQLERLSLRDQSNHDVNQKILDSQLKFEDKVSKAHFVIENSGKEQDLEPQVIELLKNIHKIIPSK